MFEIVTLEDCPPVAVIDQPSKAQWLLHVLKRLNIEIFKDVHHNLFVCFIWMSEKKSFVRIGRLYTQEMFLIPISVRG